MCLGWLACLAVRELEGRSRRAVIAHDLEPARQQVGPGLPMDGPVPVRQAFLGLGKAQFLTVLPMEDVGLPVIEDCLEGMPTLAGTDGPGTQVTGSPSAAAAATSR